MRLRAATLLILGALAFHAGAADTESTTEPAPSESRAVMTGEQVVQILDETVDWYRTLGVQQQAATQPSDLLILYANRQVAEKVMTLAFEIARANAELLSSEAGAAKARAEAASEQSLTRQRRRLEEQRASIQADIQTARRRLASARPQERAELEGRIAVLQGELDLVNARRNMLQSMALYAHQSDTEGFGANALKAHIDAIAATIPSTNASAAPGGAAPVANSAAQSTSTSGPATLSQFGLWDLAATVFRLTSKRRTIETVDERTAELQEVFAGIRAAPLEQLNRLAARGEALAVASQAADRSDLRKLRDEYDTLAWLFQQTSAIVTPLSRADVLLTQYRSNLENWRETTRRQYREALRALGWRVTLFAVMLAIVLVAAEVWRRLAFRYVEDPRVRTRWLLVRKIVLWALVIAIAASTFATELGSLATFAGLITAGLAVAMQSVLVSVVGYFFLIGRYGVRVGDRVQIGAVTGEIIELGLVRLHLMELSGQGPSPTGRVVAFPNSIIFQASGGLFKQIPGVDLAWHEITLPLPAGVDHATLKEDLARAARDIIKPYREEIVRQTQEIQRTASSRAPGTDPQPHVQLRFSATGVEAIVRYPVQLTHAAEIDERISRELLQVISGEPYGALASAL